MVHQEFDDQPQRFLVEVSTRHGILESDPDKLRFQKCWEAPELKWLRDNGAKFSIFWGDWDCDGAYPTVVIHDAGIAALFKLQFS